MRKGLGPFTGRQLTTIIVAGMMTIVFVPGTVWAVDTFSNVALQDPVSGLKASVDSSRKLSVNANYSTVYALPSTSKSPFATEYQVGNYNSVGFVAISPPTTATIAITHLAITNSIDNGSPWEVFLYATPATSSSQCDVSFSGRYRRLASRNVPAAQTLVEDFNTPITVAPFSSGQPYCLVAGAQPPAGSGDSFSLRIAYLGYVLAGTFAPPTPAHIATARTATGPAR